MKKLVLFVLFGVFSSSFHALAQSSTNSTISEDQFKELIGKYTFKDAPFEEVLVKFSNGTLIGEAVGQGSAELKPTGEVDVFEIVGFDGKVKFIRSDLKTVDKIELTFQGLTFAGDKVNE